MTPIAVESRFRCFPLFYSQLDYRNSSCGTSIMIVIRCVMFSNISILVSTESGVSGEKWRHEIEKRFRKEVRTQKVWPFWDWLLQHDGSKTVANPLEAL